MSARNAFQLRLALPVYYESYVDRQEMRYVVAEMSREDKASAKLADPDAIGSGSARNISTVT